MLLAQDFIEWLRDPKVLLNRLLGTYGVWMTAFIALIVFVEPGVPLPILLDDSMLFATGLL